MHLRHLRNILDIIEMKKKKVYYSKIICHNWAIGDSWLKWKKCLIFSSCHININLSTRFHSSAGIMCNFSCLSSDWKVRNPHWMCTIYIFMLTFEYLTNLFTKKNEKTIWLSWNKSNQEIEVNLCLLGRLTRNMWNFLWMLG